MAEIPRHVQNRLNDWESLAFTAYDWFEQMGRLAVAIDVDENDATGAKLMGATSNIVSLAASKAK